MEFEGKPSNFAQVGQNSAYRAFFFKKMVPDKDMNIRSMDMKTRKPFGLRSNYVQLRSDYVQLVQKLRKNYVKISGFFEVFYGLTKFHRKSRKSPRKIPKYQKPIYFFGNFAMMDGVLHWSASHQEENSWYDPWIAWLKDKMMLFECMASTSLQVSMCASLRGNVWSPHALISLYMHPTLSHFGKGEGASCPKMSKDSLVTSLPSQGWSCETLDYGIREAAKLSGISLEPSLVGEARPLVHVTCYVIARVLKSMWKKPLHGWPTTI